MFNSTPNAVVQLRHKLTALSFAAMLLAGCQREVDTPQPVSKTDSYPATVANTWADMHLRMIRTTPGFVPPVAARALGYAGVALYEAVAPGMPGYQSLAGQLTGLSSVPQPEAGQSYNWAEVANAVEAEIARQLYGNATAAQRASLDSLETVLAQPYQAGADFTRSKQYGQEVARAIARWAESDGGHQAYLNVQPSTYVPPTGAGMWVPTATGAGGRALLPEWGRVRTFLPANSAMQMPALSYTYSTSTTSPYYVQALEVYSTSRSLTAEQRAIANYWADGGGTITPPGHSINIATIVLKQRQASLADAAEAYARVGIAVADAFINCWKCKYAYNWERPITYIRTFIDPNWQPLVGTPPFPEFVLGHSTQSGAAAQVLSDMFGYQTAFTDNTHAGRGAEYAPRTFPNFFAFADEAAISRLYGGIHFRSGNEVGLTEGRKIGRNISQMRFRR